MRAAGSAVFSLVLLPLFYGSSSAQSLLTGTFSGNFSAAGGSVFDGPAQDEGYGLTTDASGNVYVVGLSSQGALPGMDWVVIKYDPLGNRLADAKMDCVSGDVARDVVVSGANVYVTGQCGTNKTVKYDATLSSTAMSAIGGEAITADVLSNIYVLSQNGPSIRVDKLDSALVPGLFVTNPGNIYGPTGGGSVSGGRSGSILYNGQNNSIYVVASTSTDAGNTQGKVLVLRYSTALVLQSSAVFQGNTGWVYKGHGVGILDSGPGDLYVSATSTSGVLQNTVVLRYDPINLTFISSTTLGGGGGGTHADLKVAADGNLYLAGHLGLYRLNPNLSTYSCSTNFTDTHFVWARSSSTVFASGDTGNQLALRVVRRDLSAPGCSPSTGGSANGGFAVGYDNAGNLWHVNAVFNNFALNKYNSAGVFQASVALQNVTENGTITLNFDTANNAYVVTTASGAYGVDLAVYKVGANGSSFISSRAYNHTTNNNEYALGSDTSTAGDIWIAGAIQTSGPIDEMTPGARSYAGALWKYNMALETLSGPTTMFYGAAGDAFAGDVEVDSSGALWVLSLSSNAANSGAAKLDLELRKYNGTGNGLLAGPFARPAYAADTESLSGALAVTSAAVYAAATKRNSAGNQDLAFLKFDLSGNLLFEKFWNDQQFYGNEEVGGIAISPLGTIYIAGSIAAHTSNGKLAVWGYDADAFSFALTGAGHTAGRGVAVSGGPTYLATSSTAPVSFTFSDPLIGAEGLQGVAGGATRIWNGTPFGNASLGSNWIGGAAPVAGDYVVFGDTAADNGCNWNLGISLGSITFTGSYRGTVDFASPITVIGPFNMLASSMARANFITNPLNTHTLLGSVTIDTGTFHIGGTTVVAVGSITVNRGTFEIHDAGYFGGSQVWTRDMGAGARGRFRVFDVPPAGPAVLTSTGPLTALSLNLQGEVDISTGLFLRLAPSGIRLGNTALLTGLSSFTLQGPLSPGATGINFDMPSTIVVATFTNVAFADPFLAVNINGANLLGSRISVRGASGPKAGPAFENDPSNFIDWYGVAGSTPPPSTPTPAGFIGAAFDNYGNLWAGANLANELRRFDLPSAAIYGSSPSAQTIFGANHPQGLAFEGNYPGAALWASVASSSSTNPNNRLSRYASLAASTLESAASANLTTGVVDPAFLAFQPGRGDLWVTQRGGPTSPAFDSVVRYSRLASTPNYDDVNRFVFATKGSVYRPAGIAFDRRGQPDLFVASPSSGAIYRFANDGAGNIGTIAAGTITAVAKPWQLAFDQQGNLFVLEGDADSVPGNGKLWYFDNPCRPVGLCLSGTPTLIESNLDLIHIAFDNSGRLWGVDVTSDAVVRLSTFVPQAQSQFGALSGTLSYGGLKTGQYLIAVSTTRGEVELSAPTTKIVAVSSGAFQIGGLIAPNTYYVVSILDGDASMGPNGFEPEGGFLVGPSPSTAAPVFVGVNSTATGVSVQLLDGVAFAGAITNNSAQFGSLRVETWIGDPASSPAPNLYDSKYFPPGTTNYAVYVVTGTNWFVRAFVDSNFNGRYEPGEDFGKVGPLSHLSPGTTVAANITIGASAPGVLFAASQDMAPPDLPTSGFDKVMLKLSLASVGGNSQLSSILVTLQGDAAAPDARARIFKDNGNGIFEPGPDLFLGESYFSPVAKVNIGTQTIAGGTTFFIAVSYGYIQPGRLVGVSIQDPSHLGLISGAISSTSSLSFPLSSSLSLIKTSLSARPFDQGYPTPFSGAFPSGGLDFGIFVAQGQTVQFSASGLWGSGGVNPLTGPDGLAALGGLSPGLRLGSLVGRIGGGAWFAIGASTSITASQGGSLYLAMNDSFYDDNSGQISVSVSVVASTITRVWTGNSGFNLDANIRENWQGNEPPLPGDSVTFDGAVSTKNCNWNIYGAALGVLWLKSNYTGTLRIAGPAGPGSYNLINVSSYVYLDGGTLSLGDNSEFTVQSKRLWIRGGALDMGQGYTHLRLAKPGLKMTSGVFRSLGAMGFVTVEAVNSFDRYLFELEGGQVQVNNGMGTEFANGATVRITSSTALDAFNYAKFRDFSLKSMPALTLYSSGPVNWSFKSLGFDFNVSTNVDASAVAAGSAIKLLDATGARFGTPFEKDPNNALSWIPDGGGQATVSGVISYGGLAPGVVHIRASTTPGVEFGAFFTEISTDISTGAGGYTLNLQAPNTYYLLAWKTNDFGLPRGMEPRGGYGVPGLFRSNPFFLANNDNLSGFIITLANWGKVQGSVVNNSNQIGGILVQAVQASATDQALTPESFFLPGLGGFFDLPVPASPNLMVRAFVDVNGNGRWDPFEAIGSSSVLASAALSTNTGVAITVAGGAQAPGGTLNVNASPAHPGYIANFGPQGLLKLSLSASGGDARWNALKLDLYGPGAPPKKPYSLQVWKDANNNGILDSGGPAGPPTAAPTGDFQLGSIQVPGGASSGTISFYQSEFLSPGATSVYFVGLDLTDFSGPFGGIGQKIPPVGLRMASTNYFALSQGAGAASTLLESGTAQVMLGVEARSDVWDTGLFIDRGLALTFTSTGSWKTNAISPALGPGGQAGTQGQNTVQPQANLGELLGAIGPSPWFRIGTGTVATAQYSGNLRLAMNDFFGDYWNNEGRVYADFTVSGATTSVIEGTIAYAGYVSSGSVFVRAYEKFCPESWCYVNSVTTLAVTVAPSMSYQFTGLRPNFYLIDAFVGHNPTHKGGISNALYASAGSTSTVGFGLSQGFSSISGTLLYSGVQSFSQANYLVVAATVSNWEGQVNFIGELSQPSSGSYTLANLPAPATYYLAAVRDGNFNFEPDGPEALGVYGSSGPVSDISTLFLPIYVSTMASAAGKNITLIDRGAVSGAIFLSTPTSAPLIALAGHGAFGSPGYRVENEEQVQRGPAGPPGPAAAAGGLFYNVGLLLPGNDYTAFVFADANFNGSFDPGEVFGQSVGLLSVPAGGFANADVTIAAPALPAAAQGFKAAGENGRVLFTWNSVPGATGYQLLTSTSGAAIGAIAGAATYYADALSPNVVSAVRSIRALNGVGAGPAAANIPAAASLASDPGPANFTGVFESSAAFAWGPGANSPATPTFFEVSRATTSLGTFYPILYSSVTAGLDSGLAPGVQYWYRVQAVNFNGLRSGFSAPSSTITQTGTSPALGGSVAYSGRQTGNMLVQAFTTSTLSGAPAFQTAVPNSPSQNYYLSLLGNTTYWIAVFVDVNGDYALSAGEDRVAGSSIVFVGASAVTGRNFTIPADALAPPAPLGLASYISFGQIALTWSPVSALDLAGYRVYRATAGAGPFAPITSSAVYGATASVFGASFTDMNPVAGFNNLYRVSAVDYGGNESRPSLAISVTPNLGGTISGGLKKYDSQTTGVYRVRLYDSPASSASFRQERSIDNESQGFTFTGLVDGEYFLRVFRDTNTNLSQDPGEPGGTYGGLAAPFPVRIFNSNKVSGATVTVCDRTPISAGASVAGTLALTDCPALDQGPGFYTDVYRFRVGGGGAGSIAPGANVEIRMNGTGALLDSKLFLLGPDGFPIAQDNRPGGAVISLLLPTTGIYTIEPTSFLPGVIGPYSLSLTVTGGFGGALAGNVGYAGNQTGPGKVFIQLFNSLSSNFPIAVTSQTLTTGSVPYSFPNLPDGVYYLRAYKDTNGNLSREGGEPNGAYGVSASSPAAIFIFGGQASAGAADIALSDPAVGSVSGQILRQGTQSGTIRVEIGNRRCAGCEDLDVVAFTTIAAAGSYALSFVPPATTYVLQAFVDINNSGFVDPLEARGSSSPVTVGIGPAASVALLVRDPGTGAAGNSTISGAIAYTGTSTGPVLIAVSADQRFEFIAYTLQLASTGTFSKSGVLGGSTYYLAAFMDSNNNFNPDEFLGEPIGVRGGSFDSQAPLFVPLSSSVPAGTITLQDPPNGAILGRITYSGFAPLYQPLVVQAYIPGSHGSNTFARTRIARQAGVAQYPYRLPFLAAATNYQVSAFVDANLNDMGDFGEPFAQYGQAFCAGAGPCYGAPVSVSSGAGAFPAVGVDFTLFEQGSGGPVLVNNRGIEGEIIYIGFLPGPMIARVFDNSTFSGVPRFTVNAAPSGGFSYHFLKDLLPEGTYYVDVFKDANFNGSFEAGFEPYGKLNDGRAFVLTGSNSREHGFTLMADPGAGGSLNVFSGGFSTAAGGARFDGGAADFTNDIAVDSITAGGPYVYVAGLSDQGNGIKTMLAKYDANGTKLASAFPNLPVGNPDQLFVDSMGRVYAAQDSLIRRLNADLSTAALRNAGEGAHFAFSNAFARGPGDTFYAAMAAWPGSQGPQLKIWRMDSSLAPLSTATYALPQTQMHSEARGIARDGSGNIYAMASQGALHLLLKYPADNLAASPLVADISQHIPGEVRAENIRLDADFSGNVYIVYLDLQAVPPAVRLLKFSPALVYLNSVTDTNVSGGIGFPSLDLDAAGNLYAGWTSAAGDYLVQRYDSNLVLQSSRTFDGGLGKFDGVSDLEVTDSSNVFVAGSVSGQTSLDWATLRLNLTASGLAVSSAAGSAGTITLANYVAGAAAYGGTSTGTLRALLFAVGGAAPVRQATAAVSASMPFLFNNVPPGQYLIRAFIDRNGNFQPDADEAFGRSDSAGFYFAGGSLAGLSVALCDRSPIVSGVDQLGQFTASDCPSADRGGAFQKLFTFAGTRGQIVSIRLEGAPGPTGKVLYDTYLNLYAPDGSLAAFDDDGALNGNALLSNIQLTQEGTYVISASPFSMGVTGGFKLSMSGAAGGALGSIAGNISYTGTQGGRIQVGLFDSPAFNQPIAGLDLPGPGPYNFAALKTGTTYYLGAFLDSNFNHIPDKDPSGRMIEDFGVFGGNPAAPQALYLRAGQNASAVDFAISGSTSFAPTVSVATLLGVVSYAGARQGVLRVELWPNPRFEGQPVAVRSVPTGAGPYDISVPGGQAYFVRAFLDVNGDFIPNPDEPKGVYAPNSQGAESVYTPLSGQVPNSINFSIFDPGVSSTGGGASGEGTASIAPAAAGSGALLPGVTVQVIIGSQGIGYGGRVVLGVPPGFPLPQTFGPAFPGYVTLTSTNAGATAALLSFFPAPPGAPAIEARVTSSTPLYAGATVQFVYNANTFLPCFFGGGAAGPGAGSPSGAHFFIGTASTGTARPEPLIAGNPSISIAAGAAQFFQMREGYFSLLSGRKSQTLTLEAKDNCGNNAAVTSPTAVSVRGTRYDYLTGQFGVVGGLRFSTRTQGSVLSSDANTLDLSFQTGNSSRTFIAFSTTTGDMNLEITSALGAGSTFYAGFSVLAGDILTDVAVSTLPAGTGTSAVLRPGIQTFVNFTLGSQNPWEVRIASSSFAKGEQEPVWQTWGYGQPAKGQIAWDGRYNPWINNGGRVPTGSYYASIQVGGGVRSSTELVVEVISPQLSGQALENDGTGRLLPLENVQVQMFGPAGGQTVLSDSQGRFALPGLSAGSYQAFFLKDGYLGGSSRGLSLSSAAAVTALGTVTGNISLSSTSAGVLNVRLSRAPALYVQPPALNIADAPGFDIWGDLEIHNTDYTRVFHAPLHVAAGTTTLDDGGQWDPSTQRFLAKTQFRFDVPSDTYTIRAHLPGFDSTELAGVFVGQGATNASLPAFGRRYDIGGAVTLPAGFNAYGTFVSVNAVPLSTTTGQEPGFGGVFIAGGSSSGTYNVPGLKAGSYRLSANTRGLSVVSIASVTVFAADVSTPIVFADPASATADVITGTITVVGSTIGFMNGYGQLPGDPPGRLRVHVNAWAPGSMNFGQATVVLSTNAGIASTATFRITGLDSGVEYQLFAFLDRQGEGDFDSPGGFPKRITISTLTHRNAEGCVRNAAGCADFSFEAGSGQVEGLIRLSGSDFSNVTLFGETAASARPERVGEKFQEPASGLPNFLCGGTTAAVGGDCPGMSSATFRVTGLLTETIDVTLFHGTTGRSHKQRVSIVNGLTTSTTWELRTLDVRSSTYSISGKIINLVSNAAFDTNEEIYKASAGSVPVRDAAGRIVALPLAYSAYAVAGSSMSALPYASTATLARVVAVRREYGQFNAAVSTTVDPARDRVAFLDRAGNFNIPNVTPGIYFVRTANLRTCSNCENLVPLSGRLITVTSAPVSGVDITLRTGFTASGAILLADDVLDARAFKLTVLNRRQEVVASTSVLLGNEAAGVTASSAAYGFRGLPGGEFYTLLVQDDAQTPKYAGKPIKFPDPGLSPTGLQSDLPSQNITLQRAAFLTGKLKDASSGEQISRNNVSLLASNFRISAIANPWVEGGFVLAASSVSGRPVRFDGTFLVGPLIPDIPYDLKLFQEKWDLAFLAQGSRNYAPVTLSGITPELGQTKDLGVIELQGGQSLKGVVRAAVSTTTLLGNIKVTARPSQGTSDIEVQTYTDPEGKFTLWVSTYISPTFDIAAAPRDGNTASSGKIYKEAGFEKVKVSSNPMDIRLIELVGSVTGQVLTQDGGALSYPFGAQKGFPAAAVFLQPKGVIPKNPLGDIETQTDSGGTFEVLGLSTGTYVLRAASLGYSVFNATVNVVAQGSYYIHTGSDTPSNRLAGNILTLARGAVVSGRILLPSGEAPSDSEIGGVAAANRSFTEFVLGSVESDPTAKTITGYTISGFKAGVDYDLVLLPPEGDDVTFPSEGQGVNFGASETEKTIHLTYGRVAPVCQANAKGIGNNQFRVKIACSQPLRSKIASDDDLNLVLAKSSVTSSRMPLSGPDGTGQLLGGDKKLSQDRKQLTALYRAASGEQVFSLKLDAYFPTVDPNTGDNFFLADANDAGVKGLIFDFTTGFQSATTEKVSNMKGGTVKLEDEDESDDKDERFNAELQPGALSQCSGVDANDPNCDTASNAAVYAGVPPTKLKVDVDVRKSSRTARGGGGASVSRVARYAIAGVRLPEAARALEAARAQAAGDAINPLGAFYSLFLPRGIRSQLGKPVDLTLSFDPALVSASSKTAADLDIWYQLPAGKTTCPSGKAAQNGFCIEDSNKRVDTVNNTLTVSVDHFSTFVVASTPTATSTQPYGGADIVAFNFPNPFDCIRHSKTLNSVLFQGGQGTVYDGTLIRISLPPGGAADLAVKVYNVAGELVREIPQAAQRGGFTYYTNWDCKNQGGEAVASGVYIGQVKWGDKNKFFKMAVIKGSGL